MLASITPLGERGRRTKWSRTMSFFFVGSIAGGGLAGALFGGLGWLLFLPIDPSEATKLVLIGVAATGAAVLDWPRLNIRLAGPRRQVNENWFARYRGWVYGIGFGFQLGLGLLTVITTASIYLMFFICVLSGSPIVGAVIGAVFGAMRWAAVLPAGTIKRPESLLLLSRRIERWSLPSRWITVVTELSIGALVVGVALM